MTAIIINVNVVKIINERRDVTTSGLSPTCFQRTPWSNTHWFGMLCIKWLHHHHYYYNYYAGLSRSSLSTTASDRPIRARE